jgi:hypothetical protein
MRQVTHTCYSGGVVRHGGVSLVTSFEKEVALMGCILLLMTIAAMIAATS